jgi:hypothetical protein
MSVDALKTQIANAVLAATCARVMANAAAITAAFDSYHDTAIRIATRAILENWPSAQSSTRAGASGKSAGIDSYS